MGRDVVSSALLIVVSTVVFFASNNLQSKTRLAIGPDFMPKLLAVLTFALSAVMLIGAIRKGTAIGQGARAAPLAGRGLKDIIERYPDWVSLLLIVAYALAFERVGYFVSTAVYLFVQFAIMARPQERKYPRFALIAVAVSGLSYWVFQRGFYVFLPVGVLG